MKKVLEKWKKLPERKKEIIIGVFGIVTGMLLHSLCRAIGIVSW